MKRIFLLLFFGLFFGLVPRVRAEMVEIRMASMEARVATDSIPMVMVEDSKGKVEDLTQTGKRSKLEMLLTEQKVNGWWGFNFLKIAIREAVRNGVPANTLVLLLMFPLVAALVAFSRQVIGVNGFGIFTPAVLSVAFLSTGGTAGMVLLVGILLIATLGRVLIKKVRLPYLPRLSVLIWFVSMGVLAMLLLSPRLGLVRLVGVGIFPILVFVLMVETFIEAQITRSLKTTIGMTLETAILALVAYKIMSAEFVQVWVLLHPEMSAVAILLMDYLIGRYKGLRLLEYWKFRKVVKG